MRIGLTADIHLSRGKDHPERFHALENIVDQLQDQQVEMLIIAGDCFDQAGYDVVEFDNFCKKKEYRRIRFQLLPGNHDFRLNPRSFASENVIIHTDPEIFQFDLTGLPFLFIPYQKNATMGEWIGHFEEELPPESWILVGHGDWIAGMKEPNPYEPGVYMPFTRFDVERFRPAAVFLGHIHKPIDVDVRYPGSPCPLDISETGKRRYLIIESETGHAESRFVDSDFLYYDENLIIHPMKDEETTIQNQLSCMIQRWGLHPEEQKKVRLRLRVKGFTTDRGKIEKIIQSELKDFRFYDEESPDISDVRVSSDPDLDEIARQVVEQLGSLELSVDDLQPSRERVILSAIQTVYGV